MAWLRRLLLLLLFPAAAFGQGMRYDNFVAKPLATGGLQAISGALITVCTSAGAGTPCVPKVANIYSDEALIIPIVGTGGAGTTNSDANGNFGFYAVPGSYVITVTGTGITSYTIKAILPLGTKATNTYTNNNNIFWAGPGATPTIDQAIASCVASGVAGCRVEISPGYTGAESTSLLTTSTGYSVFSGANNVTVLDYRSQDIGLGTPLYSIGYGGRSDGELVREQVNGWCSSATDSCVGIAGYNWLNGTFPSNGGLMAAATNVTWLHDTVTVGSSVSETAGEDSELRADATSSDNPLFRASAHVGGVLFSRVAAAQNILEADTFLSKSCSNAVGAPAKFFYCYGFRAQNPTFGTYRNFGFSNQGDWLTENGTKFYAEDSGTTCTIAASPTGAVEVGQTVTLTLTAPCAAATPGQHIKVTGVGVAGYNIDAIVLTGAGATTLTYFDAGTSGLAGSGAGTVTPFTPRVVTSWTNTDLIINAPLSDTQGWRWRRQDLTTDIVQITNGGLFAAPIVGCTNNGTCSIGGGGTAPTSLFMFETTAPAAVAGQDVCYGDSTAHALKCNYNNGTAFFQMPQLIASGTSTLTANAALAAVTSQAAITTAATNTLTTDAIEWSYASAPTAGDSLCHVSPYVTAGNVNFVRTNPTAAAQNVSAIVINWRVIR